MRPLLAAALLLALATAGCAADEADPELTGSTYRLQVAGMPAGPVAPGATFNVTLRGTMGDGMPMHRMDSDHIGAHFWNRTTPDPAAQLGNATTCAHRVGQLPGEYQVTCTAPMQPGTYHLRVHTRMADGHEHGVHHYWGDEMPFTVQA